MAALKERIRTELTQSMRDRNKLRSSTLRLLLSAITTEEVAGETARELAYRLYNLCERKKWPKEALAYNALVVSWPEILQLADEGPLRSSGQQTLV